jgi:hypothetical protein
LERCSYGSFILEPDRGGAWEVTLDSLNPTGEDYVTLVNAVTRLVALSRQVNNTNEFADIIVVLLPPGTKGKLEIVFDAIWGVECIQR